MVRDLQQASAIDAHTGIVDMARPARLPLPASPAVGGTVKRALDIALSAVALVLLSPVFLIVAIAVKLCDGGPILFRHRRVGHQGRPFDCLKFRSMCTDSEQRLAEHLRASPEAAAEWAATQKLRADPRLTAIGASLRRSSLDELPQLINVLRGDMSLVGPRPVAADEIARYDRDALLYLSARPGLTGAWQVSGRNDVSYAERVRLDAAYCTSWSLATDILIMLRTVPVLFSQRGSF